MKANKKSLFLLLTAFLLCLLPLSACSEAGAQKSSETDSSSQRTVYMEIPIKPLTLGDLVQNYYAISYGKIWKKVSLWRHPIPYSAFFLRKTLKSITIPKGHHAGGKRHTVL